MINDIFSLKNKTILVTGASSGIGMETARVLSDYGAKLIITGRNKERLASAIASFTNPELHSSFSFDISEENQVKELVESLPAIDGMVYSAGVIDYSPFKNLNKEKYNRVFDINYFSAIQLTALLLKNKKVNNGASLVYISSISSIFGVPATTYYGASKAALNSSIKVLASEVASKKIRANTIMPGIVRTPMIEEASGMIDSDSFEESEKLYPLGLGKPEDIAHTCLFLLSDGSRWITGTSILIDGGYSLI